ncbi:MAG: hypothetical protein IJ168_11760 [Eubacterium sp.]|nr:hypothetical protein [Eubacterium sp.]
MKRPPLPQPLSGASLYRLLTENRAYAFSVLCYLAGLLLGSFLYADSATACALFQRCLAVEYAAFPLLLISRLTVYLFAFLLTVLMGFCLFGFPFMSLVPLCLGAEAAMTMAYYYIEYGWRGFGYTLLAVAPEVAALATVLLYTAVNGAALSKSIYDGTLKKSDTASGLNLKGYLIKNLLYCFLVALLALVNTGVDCLLKQLIHF